MKGLQQAEEWAVELDMPCGFWELTKCLSEPMGITTESVGHSKSPTDLTELLLTVWMFPETDPE